MCLRRAWGVERTLRCARHAIPAAGSTAPRRPTPGHPASPTAAAARQPRHASPPTALIPWPVQGWRLTAPLAAPRSSSRCQRRACVHGTTPAAGRGHAPVCRGSRRHPGGDEVGKRTSEQTALRQTGGLMTGAHVPCQGWAETGAPHVQAGSTTVQRGGSLLWLRAGVQQRAATVGPPARTSAPSRPQQQREAWAARSWSRGRLS